MTLDLSAALNPLFGPATFAGFKVVTDLNLVNRVEDWSGVRSPARARRRMKRGPRFRQNVVVTITPKPEVYIVKATNTAIMHPETLKRLRDEIDRRDRQDRTKAHWGGWNT